MKVIVNMIVIVIYIYDGDMHMSSSNELVVDSTNSTTAYVTDVKQTVQQRKL